MSKVELSQVASVVFAAGKGTRMVGYGGNKTLLPLIPKGSGFEGDRPLLVEVLTNLPVGPKALVVNHKAEDVIAAALEFNPVRINQPETNGTGGALLAAYSFIAACSLDTVLITMGDVPMIRPETYASMVRELRTGDLVVLGFSPVDRAQYGMIDVKNGRALRIVEWKYWREFASGEMESLRYCNAGVYAARRPLLIKYMEKLRARPHRVRKQRGDDWVYIQEYFLTDIVELMSRDGHVVTVATASEQEVMGVDTPESLVAVQKAYCSRSIG